MGRYTVHIRLRWDNPYWPQYVVYIGETLIGKSFSMPDEGCCRWLEAQAIRERIRYADQSPPRKHHPMRLYPNVRNR